MDTRARLKILADASAACAHDALARFVNRRLAPARPYCEWVAAGAVAPAATLSDDAVGLFAELEGGIAGKVALLLSGTAMRALVRDLVQPGRSRREWFECSALLEASNIAFSAAASSLGDALGLTVFPSVPRLGLDLLRELPPESLDVANDAIGAYLSRARLVGATDTVEVAFAWIPALVD